MFQQRVNKLEQEKEHWMLELQLLKIKYENELTVSDIVTTLLTGLLTRNLCIYLKWSEM